MHECIYLVLDRREARFAGQRLDRSFLPQVLQQLCFFVLPDRCVYVAVVLHERTSEALQQWARRILSECGERCDPHITLGQLRADSARFSEVHLGRGESFLTGEL